MRLTFVFLILASAAFAGEYAVFASGGRLRVERHEPAGDKVILHIGGGSIEMDAREIARFEPEEPVPPPAAAAEAPREESASAADARQLVDEAARRYAIPESLLHSLVKAESGYRQDAVSPKGAIGLMQLMPGTARMYGADPTDAAQNVETGTRYFAELLQRYDGGVRRALAAYNAGPGAVDRHNGNIPPYRETREYVRKIEEDWKRAEQAR